MKRYRNVRLNTEEEVLDLNDDLVFDEIDDTADDVNLNEDMELDEMEEITEETEEAAGIPEE